MLCLVIENKLVLRSLETYIKVLKWIVIYLKDNIGSYKV